MPSGDYIQIGQIYREHGVNGFCKAHIFSGGDDNLTVGAFYELRHEMDGSRIRVNLAELSTIGRYFLLKFDKLNSPEALLTWRKAGLWLCKANLSPADDGDMYDFEWAGYTILDKAGSVIGMIAGVDYTPLRQFRIMGANGREILIPLTPAWIVKLDRSARHVIVNVPEGLLDLC